jgi:hypothetical protein
MQKVPIHITYDELNLITMLLLILFGVGVWAMHRGFRKWVGVQVRDFRIEMMRTMTGTIATREEMKESREKLLAVEAKVDYVEAVLAAHIGNGANHKATE